MKLVALTLLLSLCSSALGAYSFLAQGCTPIKRNFLAANEECVKQGMILATPDTAEKNGELNRFFGTHALAYAYISANDIDEEGTFVWMTTGQPVTNTGVWHKGEPNNHGDQDCADLSYLGHVSAWDDLKCDWVSTVICETTTDEGLALAKARIPNLRKAFERKYGAQPPVVNNGLPITPVF